jgi:ribosomal protein L14E/L6E/L27E
MMNALDVRAKAGVVPGQVILVKRGRDKGNMMIVLAVENEGGAVYLRLTDGKTRLVAKPKKKKITHVQPTNTIVDLQRVGPRGLQDADIRKMLGEEVSALGKN